MQVLAWTYLIFITVVSLAQIYTGVEAREGGRVIGAIIGFGMVVPLCGRILGWW